MAVVNENSEQANALLTGRTLGAYKAMASGLWLPINHSEAVAGDATSVQRLTKIPAGLFRFWRGASFLNFSAFGASRVLDIGWEAYKDRDGNDVVADPDGLNVDLDVSAAGSGNLGAALTRGYKDFDSRDGVWIVSVVAGGTIPANATIDGCLFLTK
jgi:hypothetical protein